MTAKAITIQGFGLQESSKKDAKKDKNAGFDSIMNLTVNENQKNGLTSKGLKLNEDKDYTEYRKGDGWKEKALYVAPPQQSQTERLPTTLQEDQGELVSNLFDSSDFSIILKEDGQETTLDDWIKDLITDELDMGSEDWERILEKLGMQAMDLFMDDENLKQFILEANQAADPIEFLTNEPMMRQLEQILSTINELKQQMGSEGLTEGLADDLTTFEPQVQELNNQVLLQGDSVENVEEDSASIPIIVEDKSGLMDKVGTDSNQKQTESNNQGSSSNSNAEKAELPKNESTSMLDVFVQNLEQAANTENVAPTEQVPDMREIVTQVVEQIKIHVKPDQTGMEIQLNPEHLGKVNISVVLREGVATANFIVQNEMVKEALQSHMQILRENLEQQGLKVEAVEVTVSEFGFEQSQSNQNEMEQKQNKKTTKNLFSLKGLEGAVDEATQDGGTASVNGILNGNLVDFIA